MENANIGSPADASPPQLLLFLLTLVPTGHISGIYYTIYVDFFPLITVIYTNISPPTNVCAIIFLMLFQS